MSRRSRLHYTLTTIGYGASRMKARLPRSTCLLGDSLSFGAAVRYKLPSHTTSRQNQTPQPQSLGSVRAIAFRSWLPPIGPIKDSHLQSLRHARRNFGYASASRTQPHYQPQSSHLTWCKDWGVVRFKSESSPRCWRRSCMTISVTIDKAIARKTMVCSTMLISS